MELECVCARSTINGGVPPPEWPWCSATDSAVDPAGMPSSSLVVVIPREAPWVSAPPLNWPLGDEQQFLSGITSTRSFSREYEYKDHSHFWALFREHGVKLNRDLNCTNRSPVRTRTRTTKCRMDAAHKGASSITCLERQSTTGNGH